MAKNRVISGDYEGATISASFGIVTITQGFTQVRNIDKTNVADYEVIDEERRKSAGSAVGRGLVGGVLLGPVGLLAGGLSAKSKGTHTLAILFHDGKKSLIEVDDKTYKAIVKKMF